MATINRTGYEECSDRQLRNLIKSLTKELNEANGIRGQGTDGFPEPLRSVRIELMRRMFR